MAWVEKHGPAWRVRYRTPDGTLASETGFTHHTTAKDRARDIESDLRRGTFVDPTLGDLPLREWVPTWREAHDVSPTTQAKYDSHLRNHILPKFGDTPLKEISRMTVKGWIKTLRRSLAERTVGDVVTLLSMLLGDAVDEGLIGANPCRRLRVDTGDHDERPHASPWQVRTIAQRCSPATAVLVVTAAYTGLRWGELAGLRRHRVDLTRGTITVDPKDGALQEVNGRLELGPPKTKASARTVHLPPFLVELLKTHHAEQNERLREHVFTGADGALLRRTNFRRRTWLPIVGGDTRRGWAPVLPGLHFHDLRHTHKTWLIEDGVPEVLQHKRLGHRMPGIRGTYSHVTQVMVDAMLDGLQRRWERSVVTSTPNGGVTTYGAVDHTKIICSQFAPTTAKKPIGEDHRPAV
ncbi:tyrosine-type recombinase/integrase [Saccharothrix lopnurensis]|uniref:Tyrosine-type recombinase/integrase n=1 Tax=Saccharothrix lopnurensis TaxID=1670621 RepID=A0ABW1P956_9PSEU